MSTPVILADFCTPGEAARVLGVSRVTIWRWIKAGKLEVVRIGREVLIWKEDMERLRRR